MRPNPSTWKLTRDLRTGDESKKKIMILSVVRIRERIQSGGLRKIGQHR